MLNYTQICLIVVTLAAFASAMYHTETNEALGANLELEDLKEFSEAYRAEVEKQLTKYKTDRGIPGSVDVSFELKLQGKTVLCVFTMKLPDAQENVKKPEETQGEAAKVEDKKIVENGDHKSKHPQESGDSDSDGAVLKILKLSGEPTPVDDLDAVEPSNLTFHDALGDKKNLYEIYLSSAVDVFALLIWSKIQGDIKGYGFTHGGFFHEIVEGRIEGQPTCPYLIGSVVLHGKDAGGE